MTYDWRPGGFGIYIHWPFCESKCPYCDFNSHVSKAVDQQVWARALVQEIDRYALETQDKVLGSIYFGGGTPSLMQPAVVAELIQRVRDRWSTVNDLEITLEANPGSVEAEKFEKYRQAGVNRVSLGIQALDDKSLRLLGRLHSKANALNALEIAKNTFERVSFDLIYSRQDQTLSEWESELTGAVSIAGDHLSLYQLTIEDGTAFGDRAAIGKLPGLPDEELSAKMYELTQQICRSAGFGAYEVSNYAKEGSESRHNLVYWRGGDYVGVGPGAHGRISSTVARFATVAHRAPGKWLDGVQSGGGGESDRQRLSAHEIALEHILMSLRTSEGMNRQRYAAILGEDLNEAKLARLSELGFLDQLTPNVRVNSAGRLILNAIISDLAPD
jgi:putative oxygen-independent coproporphyrinogen III oxidase